MSITFIGHVSKDINVFIKNGIKEKQVIPGGGVFFGAIASAALGEKTTVITKVVENEKNFFNELEKNRIRVKWIFSKANTSIQNTYPTNNPDHRISKMISKADEFTKNDLINIEDKIIHISALWHGEFPEELIPFVREKSEILGLDAQGFLRNIDDEGNMNYSDWNMKKLYLPLVDVFKVDIKEAYILTQEEDPIKALKVINEYGPKEVLLTHNKGILLKVGDKIYESFFEEYKIEGRTGRGDTCVAAYLIARSKMNYQKALDFAAKITTEKMQYKGPYKRI
ncbi:MAG: carbohydrate kinase [Marinitoga sp. 4572_148]|nr:MAG: carbohydrate kinase [Marinitoga sp. 4572_148]